MDADQFAEDTSEETLLLSAMPLSLDETALRNRVSKLRERYHSQRFQVKQLALHLSDLLKKVLELETVNRDLYLQVKRKEEHISLLRDRDDESRALALTGQGDVALQGLRGQLLDQAQSQTPIADMSY